MIPMPEPHQEYRPSLTMQYALAPDNIMTPPRLTLHAPPLPPRPHSDPGHLETNKAKFGLDDFEAMPTPPTPTRVLRSASVPPSPTVSSSRLSAAGGSRRQCQAISTSTKEQCKRVVKYANNPAAISVVMPNMEVEVYCSQHAKAISNGAKHLRIVASSGEQLIEYSSAHTSTLSLSRISRDVLSEYIPDYLSTHTKALLRTEMMKKPSPGDEDGYIYAYLHVREYAVSDSPGEPAHAYIHTQLTRTATSLKSKSGALSTSASVSINGRNNVDQRT